MEKCLSSEESDVGEGVCTRLPVQGHRNFSASKDIFSNLMSPSSLQTICSSREAVSLLTARSTMVPCRERAQAIKQAPSKQADLQVQAFDLSRESRSRGNSPCIKDILADRSFERRLTKSVDDLRCEVSGDSRGDLKVEQTARQAGQSPTRINEALMELLDVRVAELSQKLMGFLSDVIDSRVEARLAALESQAAYRTSYDNEMARNMGEEICAMGSQITALNNRISKITTRPPVRIEHVTALEERVTTLDMSLSELRCEYLEGCLRAHQMEELLIALHSNVHDIRAAQSESKQASSTEIGSSDCSSRKQSIHNHNFSNSETAAINKNRLARLETISEVPMDETPEEALPIDDDQDSPEGEFSHSPETVPHVRGDRPVVELASCNDSNMNIDRTKGDVVAPELAIEPHTPGDEMAALETQS